jgi:hypothetical protein
VRPPQQARGGRAPTTTRSGWLRCYPFPPLRVTTQPQFFFKKKKLLFFFISKKSVLYLLVYSQNKHVFVSLKIQPNNFFKWMPHKIFFQMWTAPKKHLSSLYHLKTLFQSKKKKKKKSIFKTIFKHSLFLEKKKIDIEELKYICF